MEKKRGRPTRKAYAGTCLTQELMETVSAVYAEKQEIKATALALEFPPHKVKKLLITHGDIHYAETDQIIEMQRQALRISDQTAFFLLGDLVEYGSTEALFSQPVDKRTENYITGRFG